jgi:hypothetical protein
MYSAQNWQGKHTPYSLRAAASRYVVFQRTALRRITRLDSPTEPSFANLVHSIHGLVFAAASTTQYRHAGRHQLPSAPICDKRPMIELKKVTKDNQQG